MPHWSEIGYRKLGHSSRACSNAKLRLFCFPHAGSSGSAYRNWGDGFRPEIEFEPVELPGRGARADEPLIAEISQLPLRLAWAITVHKSQGMSLDAAEIDLGKSFDCLLMAMRLKALRIDDDDIMAVYDITNPEFAKIREESKVKDSGCLAGPEFLLYIPSTKTFATYFMASPTAKRVAPKVRSFIDEDSGTPGPATLSSILIKGKKFQWFGPAVQPCNTPFDIPSEDDAIDALHKFQNPPSTDVEKADTAKDSDRAR